MQLHILGICGTFMSGLAILAKQSGYQVTGSDLNVYPPMSTQLAEQNIGVIEGYDPKDIPTDIDCFIVGNVIKRGNPSIEYILANNLPYFSGPEWLYQHILKNHWVLAVAGTHGKTTTTSLLTWIMEEAKLHPSFLIGGVPENFGVSARITDSSFFVIEADEYDCAFFDKRSKFLHYHPKTLILNNLEYDHADIFPDLAAIKQQFHYLIRTVPNNGALICYEKDQNLQAVLSMGNWTPVVMFGGNDSEWRARLVQADGSEFEVFHGEESVGCVKWQLLGSHNVNNALAAIAAAHHAGVSKHHLIAALSTFKNVKRRLEIKGNPKDIFIYDDFAHHPTAIATTLAGLRAKIGEQARMIAVLEFGSYTMKAGVHKDKIEEALNDANMVICHRPKEDWGLQTILAKFKQPTAMYDNVETLISSLVPELRAGDHVVIMSNSSFGGIHKKLIEAIEKVKYVHGN